MGPRYRWVVLAVGAFGAAAFTALRMGFPALGPELRDVFGLSLGEIGLAIAALSIGVMLTTVPWGMLTDRIGERPVLAGGLFATSLAILAMAFTEGFPALLIGLFVAGAFGASATGASGRAVMGWFTRHERGYALGIRQMALPVGGSLGSIALPLLAGAGG
jgi:sugar phosphate permease